MPSCPRCPITNDGRQRERHRKANRHLASGVGSTRLQASSTAGRKAKGEGPAGPAALLLSRYASPPFSQSCYRVLQPSPATIRGDKVTRINHNLVRILLGDSFVRLLAFLATRRAATDGAADHLAPHVRGSGTSACPPSSAARAHWVGRQHRRQRPQAICGSPPGRLGIGLG